MYLTLEYTVLESKNYCVKPKAPGEWAMAPCIPVLPPEAGRIEDQE